MHTVIAMALVFEMLMPMLMPMLIMINVLLMETAIVIFVAIIICDAHAGDGGDLDDDGCANGYGCCDCDGLVFGT